MPCSSPGVSDVLVDEKEIYNIVYRAFDDSNFEPIHYDADKAEFIPLDLSAVHDAVFAEPINASYDKEKRLHSGIRSGN